MASKKKAITIKIPIELDTLIEKFVKKFNETQVDRKTSKSEFIEIASIKLLREMRVLEDKESKDRKEN